MTGVNANNYRYLRLGHILLCRAGVAAFEGDFPIVIKYVNMIRERAGNKVVMGKVLINKLPGSVYPLGPNTTDADYLKGGSVDWTKPAATYKIGKYTSFADRKEAMRAVHWELRLEFATEGMRFFDLRRWDKPPTDIRTASMADILNAFAKADKQISKSTNKKRTRFLSLFLVAENIELLSLLKHFYLVVDLYDIMDGVYLPEMPGNGGRTTHMQVCCNRGHRHLQW